MFWTSFHSPPSVTIGLSILNILLTMATPFSDELRLLLGPPTVALPSAMACHVFRSVIVRAVKDPTLHAPRVPRYIRYPIGAPVAGALGEVIVIGNSALTDDCNISISQSQGTDDLNRNSITFKDHAARNVWLGCDCCITSVACPHPRTYLFLFPFPFVLCNTTTHIFGYDERVSSAHQRMGGGCIHYIHYFWN